jgi:uncharacterized membrane protein YsdA (DUF1294 family)
VNRLRQLPLIVIIYAVASLITFVAYGWDKRRSTRGGGRVPEQTLHLLELLGGWPGALLAQRTFRHKWKKGSYMLAFWTIVVVHLTAWVLWFMR